MNCTHSVFFALLSHGQGVICDLVGLVHGLRLHGKGQGPTPVLSIDHWLQGPQAIGLVGDEKIPGDKKVHVKYMWMGLTVMFNSSVEVII